MDNKEPKKKRGGVSQFLSRFRWLIQAGATLLSNIHLPNFFKGGIYQGKGKAVCVPGLNCYSCPAASGACPIGSFQAVVGSSKFSFSYYITGFLILIGVLLGRFICGFVTMKLNDQNMIRLGQFFIAVGAVLMLLPLGYSLLFIGLILIGLGCAPIYPSIIHETPANFGADLSQGIIGIQMAFAYIGTCLMPPVFGVLGQHISFGLYPVFLMAILILMVVMAERMHRVTAEKRNSYKANY